MTVLQLPPRENLRRRVSFELRYGTWFCFRGSHKALIQPPRASRDLLIFAPSNNLAPRFLVALARSLPARSMILRVAIVCGSSTFAFRSFWATLICSTACDRDDVALAAVGDIVLSSFPLMIISMTSPTFWGRWLDCPATETAWFASSRNISPVLVLPGTSR